QSQYGGLGAGRHLRPADEAGPQPPVGAASRRSELPSAQGHVPHRRARPRALLAATQRAEFLVQFSRESFSRESTRKTRIRFLIRVYSRNSRLILVLRHRRTRPRMAKQNPPQRGGV